MCQHKAPHREWQPAIRHLGHDGDRRYPEPATLFDDYAGRGPAERDQDMTIASTMTPRDLKLTPPEGLTADERLSLECLLRAAQRRVSRRPISQGRDLVRWKYNRYMHDYLAASRPSTKASGGCSSSSTTQGLAENTIVVYSSDQGFYLGEHGWFDKRWIFEESLRTPLLVRWPGVASPGGQTARLVSNLDFAETFLDAAGLPVPRRHAGPQPRSALEGADAAPTGEPASITSITNIRRRITCARTTASSPTATSSSASMRPTSTTGSCSTSRLIRTSCAACTPIRHTRAFSRA